MDPEPFDRFRQCVRCHTVYLLGYIEFYRPPDRKLRYRWCTRGDLWNCKVKTVLSDEQVMKLARMRPDEFLSKIYGGIYRECQADPGGRGPAQLMLSDLEQRLGMVPLDPTLAKKQFTAHGKADALRILVDVALPEVPVIDQKRIEFEYDFVREVWGSRRLWQGSIQDALVILKRNLDFEMTKPLFSGLEVISDPGRGYAQISCVAGRTFTAYRLWKGASSVALCGHRSSDIT